MQRRRPRPPVLCSALAAVLMASVAYAGQVHIKTQSNSFSPASMIMNAGDHAVWVWTGNGHTVTSGATPPGGTLFDSGNMNVNAAFTWKSGATGNVPYFCLPHFAAGMVGQLTVAASGVPVADFRITEVQYNAAGGLDLIEITNFGQATGDLGRYRFVSSSGSATVPTNSFNVVAGGIVTVHVNASGTPSASVLYLPTLPNLADVSGSLALYAPNTKAGTSLTDVTQIIDFVQWGSGGNANEATAAGATPSMWTAGEFVPTVAANHAIEFCGDGGQRGSAGWAEVSAPNFGLDGGCTTHARTSSWGRIKTLYR